MPCPVIIESNYSTNFEKLIVASVVSVVVFAIAILLVSVVTLFLVVASIFIVGCAVAAIAVSVVVVFCRRVRRDCALDFGYRRLSSLRFASRYFGVIVFIWFYRAESPTNFSNRLPLQTYVAVPLYRCT